MNNKTAPKDFFVHVAAMIALCVAVGALINLVLSLMDYILPDTLAGYFSAGSIAWPVSMLVVLVPLLYILEWILKKDITRIPEKIDLWVRRWRIYLTLFLTGATIVGDLIAIINTYLNGEITVRFIYKALAIFVIAGVVFAYYILDRAVSTSKVMMWRKVFSAVGLIAVVASIIIGFVIVGSPAKQRALRFDDQRVNDLMGIQSQIVSYWQSKAALPVTLADLNDSISGYIAPNDPDTQGPYEYSVLATSTAPLSFELCATFNMASQAQNLSETWNHDIGRTCFTRNIDKVRYPVNVVPTVRVI